MYIQTELVFIGTGWKHLRPLRAKFPQYSAQPLWDTVSSCTFRGWVFLKTGSDISNCAYMEETTRLQVCYSNSSTWEEREKERGHAMLYLDAEEGTTSMMSENILTLWQPPPAWFSQWHHPHLWLLVVKAVKRSQCERAWLKASAIFQRQSHIFIFHQLSWRVAQSKYCMLILRHHILFVTFRYKYNPHTIVFIDLYICINVYKHI